jgi:outer membrane protein assembly factor BamD (BamD/ComL family)
MASSPSSTVRRRGRAARVLGSLLMCAASLPLLAQSTGEVTARNQLELAKNQIKDKKYAAGLQDLADILKNYPTTSVADDAMLEQARYQLEVARNPVAARALTDTLRRTYAESDSRPMSYVLDGRSALLVGRSPSEINLAIENFERVAQLFKGNAAIPEAMYRAAAAARIGGNAADAVRRYTDLATRYPTSEWTTSALLESALALMRAGQPVARAMEQLQRVRNKFPQSSAATTALAWNTALYRLYLRAQAQPAYEPDEGSIGGAAGRLRDVSDLAVNDRNQLVVASKTGATVFTLGGSPSALVPSDEPRAVFFDRDGQFLTVHELGISDSQGRPVPLEMPPDGDHPLRLKIEDAVMTAAGDYLLADRDRQAIYRFSAAGKPGGEYASRVRIRRMAINDLDQVAVLGDKAVVIFGRDGKNVGQIVERAINNSYRLQDPSDICVDAFGHIYVLDRSTVFVFAADGSKLLTSFALPERVEAQRIAVDVSGRLYVYDGRSDTIQIYR